MSDSVASIAAIAPVTSGLSNSGSSSLAPSPPAAAEPPMDFQKALGLLNDHFGSQQPPLLFHTSRDDGDLVITVVDPRDNSVVRQMPSHEVLRLARNLERGNPALMPKQKA